MDDPSAGRPGVVRPHGYHGDRRRRDGGALSGALGQHDIDFTDDDILSMRGAAKGAAAGAGWIIGVLGGVHGLDTLGATPHTHLLPSVADLPKVFEGFDRGR